MQYDAGGLQNNYQYKAMGRWKRDPDILNKDKRDRQFYEQHFLGSARWKKLRTLVKEKFGYKCQACNKSNLESNSCIAHHIQPIQDGGEADDLNNITALCYHCHKRLHLYLRQAKRVIQYAANRPTWAWERLQEDLQTKPW